MEIFIASILIITLVVFIILILCAKKYCEKLTKIFFDDLVKIKNTYISYNDALKFLKKYEVINQKIRGFLITFNVSQNFKIEYKNFLKNRDRYNEDFKRKELNKFLSFFSNIEGKSLDKQQRLACIVNEDNNLVVAGAGSGKTLTICSKVQYLLKKGVNPSDIVCISFTNKVCDELSKRLKKISNQEIDVLTFHKLALQIIGKNKSIADENKEKQILEEAFLGIREKDIKVLAYNLVVYCSQYIKMQSLNQEDENELVTIKDVLKHVKEMSKLKKYQRGTNTTTLCNEKVKSQFELDIANFLFVAGIKYEYETFYKTNNPEEIHTPDFYLPEYDIYIEHFGIDETGTASWLKDNEKIKKYSEDMEWKKKLHQKNGTKLICTYSYQRDGMIDYLMSELKKNNVKFRFCSKAAIDLLNKESEFDKTYLEIILSFIKLFKNRNLPISEFEKFKANATTLEKLSLEIIQKIYEKYQEELANQGLIDFEDIINLAITKLENGASVKPYKYIIVDEYQDVSISKVELLKLILAKNEAKLMAVGDDWQSIYRFAGSEVSLISNFKKYFKHSEILKIEKTYRNSKELINISGKFILKNKTQISKQLISDKNCYNPIEIEFISEKLCFIPPEFNSKADKDNLVKETIADPRIRLLKRIFEKINRSNSGDNILLLVRNNADLTILRLWLNNNEAILLQDDESGLKFSFNGLYVNCLTVHKSKGLEADNVILFDLKEGYRGFPDTLGDDSILRYVLASKENIEFSEDRRLFYVALTRTKNKVYIISRTVGESRFVKELIEENPITTDIEYRTCPKCGGKLIQIYEKHYYGCENYYSKDKCTYTINANDDYELVKIRKYLSLLETSDSMGVYIPCKIIDMKLQSGAIKIKYAFCVGKTIVEEFETTIFQNDKTSEGYRTSRFIITFKKIINPFEEFEKFKQTYTNAMQMVHAIRNEIGKLQAIWNSEWYFKEFDEEKELE